MMSTRLIAAASLAGLLASGAALAQTPPVSAPAPAASAPATNKQALSKACYAKADEQGLHGKARKAFHRKCEAGKA